MITKPIHVVLYDGPQLTPDENLIRVLGELYQRRGIFIWCKGGEYRAIGARQIEIWLDAIILHRRIKDNYTVADSHLQQFYMMDWESMHPIDSMVVHWLRDEAE